MISIIANQGLGDAIYLRAIVLHFLSQGEDLVNVFTWWPSAFTGMPEGVAVYPAKTMPRDQPNLRYANYCVGCPLPDTGFSQFEMACRHAGVFEEIDLKLGWGVMNKPLLEEVKNKAAGRPILLYQPLKKTNFVENGRIRPKDAPYEKYLAERRDYFRVRVGKRMYLSDTMGGAYDMDLVDTPISDVFDLALVSDRIFCEPSFLVVLAEATNTPFTCMFSASATRMDFTIAKNINPARIFFKKHLATAIYDE